MWARQTPPMSLVWLALRGRISVAWVIASLLTCLAQAGGRAAPASWFARQTRYGVAGMSMWRMPYSESASMMALTSEGSEPAQPASPQPLTPSGLVVAGAGWLAVANSGVSAARGMA